ncbi:MAG: biotin/lipoyl-binding protein [Planctomycetia bacterium]|nr:biotin/lipoyl-binding protein [Planctomycetia bacterium]
MKLPSIFNHLGTAVLIGVTLFAAGAVGWYVVRPAYMSPANRTYTSGMGYPAVLRASGKPFPVTTARVAERNMNRQYLGEGLMESEPVRVPIVPDGRVSKVYVEEGDYVTRGQLLAELDSSLHENKIVQAKAAIAAAEVQVQRARIGSVYNMEMERPEIVKAQLERAQNQVKLTNQLVDMYSQLRDKDILSTESLIQQQLAANQAAASLREAEEGIKMSQAGRPLSIRAAELALEGARLALQRYTEEMKDFKIYAAADGMVAQVLIHEGEYNQNPGTSAFVLAVGKWFSGNFDQTTMGRFAEGATVNVRLEAFPGKVFTGRVRKVKPMVTYNPGGPEAARPIRPLGTGSPEWPATFNTRIQLVEAEQMREVVSGLTGFAEVSVDRHGLAVPAGSVTSVTAGRAIVYIVEGNSFRAQQVVIGQVSEEWVEVVSGLAPGTEIIADGYQVLQPGDKIVASPVKTQSPQLESTPRPHVPQPGEPRPEPSPVATGAYPEAKKLFDR